MYVVRCRTHFFFSPYWLLLVIVSSIFDLFPCTVSLKKKSNLKKQLQRRRENIKALRTLLYPNISPKLAAARSPLYRLTVTRPFDALV